MHMKKMEWFSKLSKEDKSHKAMMAKNKYKVGYGGFIYRISSVVPIY